MRGLYVDRPRHVTIAERADPPLGESDVRVKTEFASIKHGTEFHLFSGDSPFKGREFDIGLRLFVTSDNTDGPGDLTGSFVGNTVVGRVVETGAGVSRFAIGDRVFCYGPACDTFVRHEDRLERLVPPMTDQDAVCLDPAVFAYGAVRDASPTVGDRVVVSGMGAIGLFMIQLLRLNGCMGIIAVDTLTRRRDLALNLGADVALDPTEVDVGLAVREHLGHGADIAIEASGQYAALAGALRSVRNCATIVTLGYYKGIATHLELGAEWHHNRLQLISSMPVWDNPMREYPLWTEERMRRTLISLFQRGALTSEGIVDPIVNFADAPQAFMDIYADPSQSVKLGIRFPGE